MKRLARGIRKFAVTACALALSMGVLAAPAYADGATVTKITNDRTGVTYDDLATATAEAQSGDTIKLPKGNYTLYKVSSEGHTKGKDLTFEGSGADKTSWRIGPEVPDPKHETTEYNGDYSFDGAGTVTFRNMKMLSAHANYLGFIRIDNTVVDNCIVNGKTFYWGYTNVYTDYGAGKNDITVNVNNCTFNSKSFLGFYKQALKINDSNMKGYKYILNITGSNTVTAERDSITCSQLFGFGGEKANNSGRTDVNINGELVWTAGKMLTHDYTDGEHDNAFDVTYTEWTSNDAGTWTRTETAQCKYCGFTKPELEEKAFDLTYNLNGSEDKQTADFATVEHVTETEVTTDQPVRKGYSFVGWNTAADGSGTSYEAGAKVELSAPVTLFAQWKKDEPVEPAPKPSDTKPADKTQAGKKTTKQALPKTGDDSMLVIGGVAVVAVVCIIIGVVVFKVRKK